MATNISNVNSAMGFKQIATVLNSIVNQATGKANITPTTTADFISQAQVGLLAGVDPLMGAISQVLSRTIFSVRPYTAKFKEMEVSPFVWGNHIRKINYCDGELQDDQRLDPTYMVENGAIDQYKIKMPDVVQTNWYSKNTYSKQVTIFRDQLNSAFSGVEEFQRFISGMISNVSDQLEQAREEFARSILVNYIGAIISNANAGMDTGRVIHLATEYVTAMGITVGDDSTAAATVMDPTYYDGFIKWLFARLATISDLLTERSTLFHLNPEISNVQKYIMRHTPYDRQRMYLFADTLRNIDARVLSAAFHDNYLKIGKHNTVSYWQSIKDRGTIKVTPSTINGAGEYVSGSAVDQDNVFGIIFDEEALMMCQGSTWTANSPYNAAGGYINTFHHITLSGLNDLTENAVVLLLD